MSHLHVINRDFVGKFGVDALKHYPEVRNDSPEVRNDIKNFIDTIVKTYLKDTVKKGDALVFEKVGISKQNVYFWDGSNVISAGTKYEDEGNVPEQFLVQDGDFSPDYWGELIEMSVRGYQHFTELTLGPKLQADLYKGAENAPCIVKATINGKEFSFFIQKKEDIEKSWFYYVGDNRVVQADFDAHPDTDWHPEAQNFVGILNRMKVLQKGGKRRSRRSRRSSKKNRKTRSRK